MGWMMPGAGSLDATIPLGRKIEPGRYFLFLKDRNYDHPIGVTFSLGGGKANVTTTRDDDRDESGFWSNRIPITVKSSTDELGIRLARADDGTDDKRKLLLRGLYLTSDPDDIVLATDRVVRLAEQRTVDDSAPRPGNIIDNASFEAGLGHGWGSRDDRRFAIASLWDPSTGKDGKREPAAAARSLPDRVGGDGRRPRDDRVQGLRGRAEQAPHAVGLAEVRAGNAGRGLDHAGERLRTAGGAEDRGPPRARAEQGLQGRRRLDAGRPQRRAAALPDRRLPRQHHGQPRRRTPPLGRRDLAQRGRARAVRRQGAAGDRGAAHAAEQPLLRRRARQAAPAGRERRLGVAGSHRALRGLRRARTQAAERRPRVQRAGTIGEDGRPRPHARRSARELPDRHVGAGRGRLRGGGRLRRRPAPTRSPARTPAR